MKRYLLIITLLVFTKITMGQIGIGTTNPNANAILEIASSNKGLLIPRVALTGTVNSAPLAAHVDGMLVYNTATTGDVTPGFYFNSGGVWTSLGSGSSGVNIYSDDGTITAGDNRAVVLGAGSTLNIGGDALHIDGDDKSVGVGTNNPNESAILDISSTSKGVLFPIMTGAERDAIVNPANGLLIYNSSEECVQVNIGTPTVPNWGCVGIENTSLSGNCSGFSGVYVTGQTPNASHTFTSSVTNNSTNPLTLNFQTSDLTLSGDVGDLTVSSVMPNGATIIAAGATQNVVFTLGTSGGNFLTGNITGTFSNTGVVCSDDQALTTGDAEFVLPQVEYVLSVHDGPPLVSVDGLIDNGSNQITIDIPYTNGLGDILAFNGSGSPISNNPNAEENSDNNGFYITYPGATGISATGTITATINVDGDGSFQVANQTFGTQTEVVKLDFVVNGVMRGVISIVAVGGVPDRNFDSSNDHRFVYTPIDGFDGNVWLSHDLGANYSNFNNSAFNIAGESTSGQDFNAYGSLFQWGRYSDGHELYNWTSATSGNPIVTGTIDAISNTSLLATTPRPVDNRFIETGTTDWLAVSAIDSLLWHGENGFNNPCPKGYRVPSFEEFSNLIAIEEIENAQDATNSNFSFTLTGSRSRAGGGNLLSTGSTSEYWTSNSNGRVNNNAPNIRFLPGGLDVGSNRRGNGRKIRCISSTAAEISVGTPTVSLPPTHLNTGDLIISVPYTSSHNRIFSTTPILSSANVNNTGGLIATPTTSFLLPGSGTIDFIISGTPTDAASTATARFILFVAGRKVPAISINESQYE